MRKFIYFGVFFLFWFAAIFFARSFDRSSKLDPGCLGALDKEQKKYLINSLVLFPEAAVTLNRLSADYSEAFIVEDKIQRFDDMKAFTNGLLVKMNLDNPVFRKIIDELAGAENRFSAILQSCTD